MQRETGRRVGLIAALAACSGAGSGPRGAISPPSDVLVGVPADLAARTAELLAVTCPSGAKLVERVHRTSTELVLHRHCETERGEHLGPIVDYSTNYRSIAVLWRRGERDGLRDGPFVSIDYAFVTELAFERGHPVGPYQRRQLTTGQTVVEGRFDDRGQLDGEWVFTEPDTGRELGRSTMHHGTGTFGLWDGSVNAVYPDIRIYRAECLEGMFHGDAELRILGRPGSAWSDADRVVRAHFSNGLPDGPWELARVSDGVALARGTYDHGQPTGTWHMLAERVCSYSKRSGDVEECGALRKDVPYTCASQGPCTFDGFDPKVTPPPVGQPPPPVAITAPERCELTPDFLQHR